MLKETNIRILVFVLFLLVNNQAALAKSFLWQVQSATATVYLLGSMHLATADIYPLHVNVVKAFAKAQYLVLEVDLNPTAAYQIGKIIRDNGIYYGEETLYDNIDMDTKKLFLAYIKKRHLPAAGLIKFRPGILSMTLSASEMHYLGLKQEYGIDLYFTKKARLANMPILELESVEQQMKMLLSIPNESDFLKYTLLSLDSMSGQLKQMIAAWKVGDSISMHKLSYKQTLKEYPELKAMMTALIDDRNIKMLAKIKSFLKSDKTYFVVVGAGHLTGDIGIVALLKKANYHVKQL